MKHRPASWRRFAHFVLSGRGRTAAALHRLCGAALQGHFDGRFRFDGPLKSTVRLTGPFGTGWRKQLASIYFSHREKAEVSLAAASSWYGGDYMEFGAHGVNTFRNMLSAFDLFDLQSRFPDTRFYAFDVFGKLHSDHPDTHRSMQEFDSKSDGYFSTQFPHGDEYAEHVALVQDHGLFVDRCHLVQGYFQDTLNSERAQAYKNEGRHIGLAFIDCNIESQYKVVFEFIFRLMGEHSYIYMDEYPQSSGVISYFEEFTNALKRDRRIGVAHVRNAGGFGTLFRLYPLHSLPPLVLSDKAADGS
jgi:hypothetical protein